MRKPDEIALYARMREVGWYEPGVAGDKCPVWPDLAQEIGMPEKRTYYLLEKWASHGWWNYGVNARWGWFEPEAPKELNS